MVTPYYNKPTQEGLYQHYKAIHDAAEIPIVIYNIPGRLGSRVGAGARDHGPGAAFEEAQ